MKSFEQLSCKLEAVVQLYLCKYVEEDDSLFKQDTGDLARGGLSYGNCSCENLHLSFIITTYWLPFTLQGSGLSMLIAINLCILLAAMSFQVSLKFTVVDVLRASSTISSHIEHVVWPCAASNFIDASSHTFFFAMDFPPSLGSVTNIVDPYGVPKVQVFEWHHLYTIAVI